MKKLIKASLFSMVSRNNRVWRHAIKAQAMLCLCYHRVSSAPDPLSLHVTEGEFHDQMQWLADFPGVRPVSASEFAAIWRGQTEYGDQTPVLVTFDDGYLDNLTMGAPILRKFNIPAIMFVVSDVLEHKAIWYDRIIAIAADDRLSLFVNQMKKKALLDQSSTDYSVRGLVETIKQLDQARFSAALNELERLTDGVELNDQYVTRNDLLNWISQGFEIGAHTCSHPRLTSLTFDYACSEINRSTAFLSDAIESPIRFFAYPYGLKEDFSEEHQEALSRADMELAFTTIQGTNRVGDNRFTVRRKCVNGRLFSVRDEEFCEALFVADLLNLTSSFRRSSES